MNRSTRSLFLNNLKTNPLRTYSSLSVYIYTERVRERERERERENFIGSVGAPNKQILFCRADWAL